MVGGIFFSILPLELEFEIRSNVLHKKLATLHWLFFFSPFLSTPLPSPYFCNVNNTESMVSRIHVSNIWKIIEEKNRLNKPKPFSSQYAKKTGNLETYHFATLSSIHSKGAMVNIIPDGEPPILSERFYLYNSTSLKFIWDGNGDKRHQRGF